MASNTSRCHHVTYITFLKHSTRLLRNETKVGNKNFLIAQLRGLQNVINDIKNKI